MTPRLLIEAGRSSAGWHSISSFMVCPQMDAYESQLKMGSSDRPPLIRGSLTHVGAAHYCARTACLQPGGLSYAWVEDGIAREEVITDPNRFYQPLEAIEILGLKNGPSWMRYVDEVQTAMARYISFATINDSGLKILGVELELRALIDGKLYTDRVDALIEDQVGMRWVIDHKSSQNMEARALKAFSLDGQFLGHQWFGQTNFGAKFGGVIVNVINLSDAAKTPVFRARPEPAPWALAQFPYQVAEARKRRQALIDSGVDPMYWPKTLNSLVCMHRYGACDFFEICQRGGR